MKGHVLIVYRYILPRSTSGLLSRIRNDSRPHGPAYTIKLGLQQRCMSRSGWSDCSDDAMEMAQSTQTTAHEKPS